ncbi:MAG: phage distal tail protein, Rcc01695 family [Pseudomonadota bacterium]
MAFHEVRFPERLSVGSTGGPQRRTEVVTLANGHEQRNTNWADSRRRYDAGMGLSSLDELHEVIAFFEARRGQLHGFRWKDWLDWKSCAPLSDPGPLDQELGVADGNTSVFQLVKRYEAGESPWFREITKPVEGTVQVAVDGETLVAGAGFTVDHATGRVSLTSAPAAGQAVTAGFEFDVPVRFDEDRIVASLSALDAGDIPSIPVVEVRV